MSTDNQIEEIIKYCPYEMKTVGFYPAFLIDPCVLPLKETELSEAKSFGKYATVILKSSKPLPHGHYARLIIAYLTTEIARRSELPSHVIANSVSDLFKQVTGQKEISGGTYANFMLALERVFDITFTIEPTGKSKDKLRRRGFFAEADNLLGDHHLGNYNAKYNEVLYTPSNSFKTLVAYQKSIISIDLRFLKLARSKDIVLAHDLYIYLVRRGYEKGGVSFVPWVTLHKDIFPYLKKLELSRFKRRFTRALDLILTCHPNAGVSIASSDLGILIAPSNNFLRGKKLDTS